MRDERSAVAKRTWRGAHAQLATASPLHNSESNTQRAWARAQDCERRVRMSRTAAARRSSGRRRVLPRSETLVSGWRTMRGANPMPGGCSTALNHFGGGDLYVERRDRRQHPLDVLRHASGDLGPQRSNLVGRCCAPPFVRQDQPAAELALGRVAELCPRRDQIVARVAQGSPGPCLLDD